MTPRPRTLLTTFVALELLVAACTGGGVARTAKALHVRACTVQGRAARCGTLTVAENRVADTGRTISVSFVVIPATGTNRSTDPLVWFAGGPGDAATDAIAGNLSGLAQVNARHDLVFIDQRGTGHSNPLTCPSFPGLADTQALKQNLESCLASLPGDLRFYTTAMFVDDVDQVLGALGYSAANLMGISYGTIAEQVLLQRHPARVRTMILFSGTPVTVPVYERMSGNAQAALDSVFVRCANDRSCEAAFPHLAGDWHRLWSSLSRAPWVLTAARSPTRHEVRLDSTRLAGTMNQLMRNSATAADIPVIVHTLGGATDPSAALASVAGALASAGADLQDGGGNQNMITYPLMCNEPWATFRPQALADQRASFEYQPDVALARWWHNVCRLIPSAPAAAVGDARPPTSDIPVLTLNGEADPIDPPGNMADASQLWPNSHRLIGPGQGHDLNADSWTLCLSQLTATFIDRASVTDCLADVPTTPFALDLDSLAHP